MSLFTYPSFGLGSFYTHWFPPCPHNSECASLYPSPEIYPTTFISSVITFPLPLTWSSLHNWLLSPPWLLPVLQVKNKTKLFGTGVYICERICHSFWFWTIMLSISFLFLFIYWHISSSYFSSHLSTIPLCICATFFLATHKWGVEFHKYLELHIQRVCW